MIKKLLTVVMVGAVIGSGSFVGGVVEAKASTETVLTSTDTTLADGVYEVSNTTRYITEGNALGETMARKAISETSTIEIKEGVIYETLTINSTMYSAMNTFEVRIDGEYVDVVEDATAGTLTFVVPSVDTEVLVSANVPIMGRTVEFYVANDTSTLQAE